LLVIQTAAEMVNNIVSHSHAKTALIIGLVEVGLGLVLLISTILVMAQGDWQTIVSPYANVGVVSIGAFLLFLYPKISQAF